MRPLYQSMLTKNKKEMTEVKLFCGLIYRDLDLLREATRLLTKAFGPLDNESGIYDFDHTEYYQSEMGTNLIRRFISFEELVEPTRLVNIKAKTNEIEKKLADRDGDSFKRNINIDPGYMELSKIVLASTKNYSHRIYMGKGIFAEVTLIRKNNKFKFLPWTYPDYVHPIALVFFEETRTILKNQISE
ncbi:MAG: DUF4416 family protein [candidate division Zixibacteria bacterium]|nr:DUF4416 family protein [candidate division Zixibacteria bacterium]